MSDSPRTWSVNAPLGIVGVFLLGVFVTWFVIVAWRVPLPEDPVANKLATTTIQTIAVIVLPYWWASRRLGLSPARLGLNLRNLGRSTWQGGGLYLIALVTFMACRDDPLIHDHPIRHAEPAQALLLFATMALHAAGTDLATRGFILLSLAETSHVAFAILAQNVAWVFGHLYEIRLFAHSLGYPVAAGMIVVTGLLGDIVALRTRNVVGLALAHVLLNLAMVLFIRSL
jgi:membrane protease YdiL (CAAX protease family)